MKKILFVLISILILSCSQDDGTDAVFIRVKNSSQYEFNNIIVGQKDFGNIFSNNFSDYIQFDIAYRYNFIELQIDGNTFTIQPIDYVGESPLQNGNYTYELGANNSNEQYSRLTLTFIED